MKKVLLALGVVVLLAFGGCDDDEKEKDLVVVTNPVELSKEDSGEVELSLDEAKYEELKESAETDSDFFEVLEDNREILAGESESMDKIIEAVLVFSDLEEKLGVNPRELMSAVATSKFTSDSIGEFAVKRTREMYDDGDDDDLYNLNEAKVEFVNEILPRMNESIQYLSEAVALNETIVINSEISGGYNIKIEPAHILLLESLIKTYRGVMYYAFANELNMESEDFLMVTDRDYVANAERDLKEAVAEMIEAISNLPVSDMFVFDEESGEFDENEEINLTEVKNILSIPANLKSKIVENLEKVEAALDGEIIITIAGKSIKLNVSVIFDKSFAIANILRSGIELMPEYGNEANWDPTNLGNYKVEGILPGGVKNLVDAYDAAAWEELVNDLKDREEYEEYNY